MGRGDGGPKGWGLVRMVTQATRATADWLARGFRVEPSERPSLPPVVRPVTAEAEEFVTRTMKHLEQETWDEWTIRAIYLVLEGLAAGDDTGDPDDWEAPVSSYWGPLLDWVDRCPVAPEYCDRAIQDLGAPTLWDALTAGQALWYEGVRDAVLWSLGVRD